jgi:hypothetical protein
MDVHLPSSTVRLSARLFAVLHSLDNEERLSSFSFLLILTYHLSLPIQPNQMLYSMQFIHLDQTNWT